MTEDEMVGWYHRLDGHESEQAPGVGEWQGGLACCSSWGRKESDTTERLNDNNTLSLNKCREALGVRPSVPEKPANNPAAGKATGEPSRRGTGQRAEGNTAASWCWCLWTQGKHAGFLLYASSEPRTSCGQEQLKNSLYFSNIFNT